MYNPFSLEGKTVLVTGASSGIGRATAVECSKMGATLVLTARNEERLNETLAMLEGEGHMCVIADLTIAEDVDRLVADIPVVDGFVCNAGIIGLTPVSFISETKLSQMQAINLNSPILLTTKLVKKKKIANGGSIVFTSSAAGVYRVSMGNAIYATTKCGIDAFMRSAALELSSRKIRCNSVNPAMVETEGASSVSNEEQKQKDIERYPLKRYGMPEEIAYGVVYLLSDAAAWITGTELKMDGGLTLA